MPFFDGVFDYGTMARSAGSSARDVVAAYLAHVTGPHGNLIGRLAYSSLTQLSSTTMMFQKMRGDNPHTLTCVSSATADQGSEALIESISGDLSVIFSFRAFSGGETRTFLVDQLDLPIPLSVSPEEIPALLQRVAGIVQEKGMRGMGLFCECRATDNWNTAARALIAAISKFNTFHSNDHVPCAGFKITCGDGRILNALNLAVAIEACAKANVPMKFAGAFDNPFYDLERGSERMVDGYHLVCLIINLEQWKLGNKQHIKP